MGHKRKKTLKAFVLHKSFWEASVQQQSDRGSTPSQQCCAKSPRKTSQEHTGFAIKPNKIGVGVEYKCYTYGSDAEVALQMLQTLNTGHRNNTAHHCLAWDFGECGMESVIHHPKAAVYKKYKHIYFVGTKITSILVLLTSTQRINMLDINCMYCCMVLLHLQVLQQEIRLTNTML